MGFCRLWRRIGRSSRGLATRRRSRGARGLGIWQRSRGWGARYSLTRISRRSLQWIYELAAGRVQSRHHIRQLLTTEPDPLIHAQTEYLLEELVTRFPRHGQHIQTCAALITACFYV